MGLLGKLGRLVMDVVETPVAVVKDIATMGGALTDQETPYTVQKLKDIGTDAENIKDEIDKP
jgi:hypothetical protein